MHTNSVRQTKPLIIGVQVEYEWMDILYFNTRSRVALAGIRAVKEPVVFSCQTIFMLIQFNMASKRILLGF